METAIFVLELIGTVAFALSGVMVALEEELDLLGVAVLGTVTGVGGGLMRDQLVGRIPMVLQKRVYAIAALAGAALYYAMHALGFYEAVAVASGVLVVIAIRILATHFHWNLPRIRK